MILRVSALALALTMIAALAGASNYAPIVYAAPVVPPGFADSTVVTGLSFPTSMTFTDDGSKLIIADQSGVLFIYDVNTDTRTTLIALPGAPAFGVAFDPDFQSNQYLYVHYAATATGRYRVSRFEVTSMNPTWVADPTTEVVVLDIIGSSVPTHSGGAMHFGPDGYLYVTTGDGKGHDDFTSPDAQSLGSLLGKVLRLDPSLCSATCPVIVYPSSNPTVEQPVDDPNTRGEIWAWGFRNPFSSDFDDTTGDYYLIDVGVNASSTPDPAQRFEEINLGLSGGNYAWNSCHGICNSPPNNVPGSIDLAKFVDPVSLYDHTGDGRSIVGLAVYRESQYPSDFLGNLIYADFIGGYLERVKADSTVERFVTGLGVESVVDVRVGPADGSVYYLLYGDGEVHRVDFVQQEMCHGLSATIIGSSGPDSINGTSSDDIIVGLGGDDVINGLGGNDTICGGDGNDLISGGFGKDWLSGDAGKDQLAGDAGSDQLIGGLGLDILNGGDGKDKLFGGKRGDQIFGGNGNDRLFGGKGSDHLLGEDGDDKILGRAGDDEMDCGAGVDQANGGNGTGDTATPDCETVNNVP